MQTWETLIGGFVLTTVLGGLLGTLFQRRTWEHQHAVRATEAELARADETSQRVMELLDKRLYRMLRLYQGCRAGSPLRGDIDLLGRRLRDYDVVLFEWNDHLNANLALTGTYFGQDARTWLEQVYVAFQQVGADLENLYRVALRSESDPATEERVRSGLVNLNDRVYRLGVFLTGQILARKVGARSPRPMGYPQTPEDVSGHAIPLQSADTPGGSTTRR